MRDWVLSIRLELGAYGTLSMRRTKVAQIYKKTGNLRAVLLLLGHPKMDSTVRYLGVDLDDAKNNGRDQHAAADDEIDEEFGAQTQIVEPSHDALLPPCY